MSRKIYCNSCGKDLGEIRDARLHKDITYSCGCLERTIKMLYGSSSKDPLKGYKSFDRIWEED